MANDNQDEVMDEVLQDIAPFHPTDDSVAKLAVKTDNLAVSDGQETTVLVNFMELCQTMHRELNHVKAFLLAELGTSGSLDGQQELVVKGRFAPDIFEGILRRYVSEYVICVGCNRLDTRLSEKYFVSFLICNKCGCERSVPQIKAVLEDSCSN